MEDWVYWVGIGIIVGTWLWARNLRKEVEAMHKDVSRVMQKIVFMRVEHHDNIIFAYNAFNNEFVCQGKDIDELNARFGLRYPDRKGIIVRPDEEEAK
jgi:hypothetical protein